MGIWEKREQPKCSRKCSLEQGARRAEQRRSAPQSVAHLCRFLMHFLPAFLFPVAASFSCRLDAPGCWGRVPLAAALSGQEFILPGPGEPELGIIKGSLTPPPAAGPGFHTAGGLTCGLGSDLGSAACLERVIPAAPCARTEELFLWLHGFSPASVT